MCISENKALKLKVSKYNLRMCHKEVKDCLKMCPINLSSLLNMKYLYVLSLVILLIYAKNTARCVIRVC